MPYLSAICALLLAVATSDAKPWYVCTAAPGDSVFASVDGRYWMGTGYAALLSDTYQELQHNSKRHG